MEVAAAAPVRFLGRTGVALCLLLIVFALRLGHASFEKSFTVDEPHYVGGGLFLWATGNYDPWTALRLHPPLTFHIASAPLLGFDLSGHEIGPLLGFDLLRSSDPPTRSVRIAARAPFILLSCWGALLVFFWGREAAGDAAGLLAAFLFTFSPTLLAHGWIAHSDITVTVFGLQSLYALWRWSRRPTPWRLVACGVSLGLALISKISALLIASSIALLLLAIALRWRPLGPVLDACPEKAPAARLGWATLRLVALAACAVGALWLGYGGSFATMDRVPIPWLEGWPVPAYLFSLLADLEANSIGRTAFLLGEYSKSGWWYFFPVAFLLKTPPGLLLLLALAPFATHPARSGLGAFLAVPLGLYGFVACFLWNVPMGLRYVLPILPLVYLWAATRLSSARGGWRGAALALGCAGLVVSSALIHPHYLAYFNELAGGARRGYRYLVGSDLDWGQDLPALARHLEGDVARPVWLAYFGVEHPRRYGIAARPLAVCGSVPGTVAISASILQRLYARPGSTKPAPEGCYDWLLEREPSAWIGYSILVYEPAGAERSDSRRR